MGLEEARVSEQNCPLLCSRVPKAFKSNNEEEEEEDRMALNEGRELGGELRLDEWQKEKGRRWKRLRCKSDE